MTWSAGNIDAQLDGLFGSIDRSSRDGGRPRTWEPARVPRPARPAQPGKIDISAAPSLMEQRAAQWAKG